MAGVVPWQQVGLLVFDKLLLGILLLLGAHVLGRKLERFKSGLAREMEMEKQRVAAAREVLEALLALDAALVAYRNSRVGTFDASRDAKARASLREAISAAGSRVSSASLLLPHALIERMLIVCSGAFDFVMGPLVWRNEEEANASTMAAQRPIMEAADLIRSFVQEPHQAGPPMFGPSHAKDTRWDAPELTRRLEAIREGRQP